MAKWVQSKYSKDAKKWEVVEEYDKHYHVRDNGSLRVLWGDEYIECDPPERWETCTREMIQMLWSESDSVRSSFSVKGIHPTPVLPDGYRWAWSETDQDALVIQRKVSG